MRACDFGYYDALTAHQDSAGVPKRKTDIHIVDDQVGLQVARQHPVHACCNFDSQAKSRTAISNRLG
jgi:hypothetical protein